MPIPGAAEAPGPMTLTRGGRLVAVYAPYNTFDASVEVDRNQIVLVKSDDDGQTWSHTSMLRFADPDGGGAESWVVELADRRLVGTAWNMSLATGRDEPIPFGISHDGGDTWTTTRSTGIRGQATSLAPLPDGRLLLVYNQREQPDPGVWLAVADPSDHDFGVQRIGPGLARRAGDPQRRGQRPRRLDRLLVRRAVGDAAAGRRRHGHPVVRPAVGHRHPLRPPRGRERLARSALLDLMARYPQTILVSCPIPWDEREELIEDLFREEVRRTLALGFTDVYVFGTGGEGYAVDTRRYRQVVEVFREETRGEGIRPMVGAIGLSTPILIERLRIAHDAGFRTFQISLPSWGPLNDDELIRFFEDVCGAFPDSRFLHYNLGRTKRILNAADYRRLIPRLPNLVATKTTSGELPMAADLVDERRRAPALHGRQQLPVRRDVRRVLAARVLRPADAPSLPGAVRGRAAPKDLERLVDLLKGFHQVGLDLWSAPKSGPHIDGCYDKMLCKLGLLPEFPLRLLSPYQGFDEADYQACKRVMETRYPDWLAEPMRRAAAAATAAAARA